MSQENTTATTSEGKNISFSVPKVSNSETKDIKSNTESSGFDRSPNNDLELSTYETHSIDENVEPHSVSWYKDPTKRKWFTYGVIVTLIVVIIIVIPVSVANALKKIIIDE
ncbi:unnamed protein product [Rhizophagus irregularis]|nr:unnamed protein product [Rhizophagus irregularis]